MYKKSIRFTQTISDWLNLKRLPAREKGEAPRPETFEKVPQKSIEQGLVIQQHFAEDLCRKIYQQLSLETFLTKLQVIKLDYEDFVAQMSPQFIVQLSLEYPGLGSVYGFWGYSLVQAIINRLTGGEGKAKIENEEFTEIEKAVFESVLQEGFSSLSAAWQKVLPKVPQKFAINTPRFKKMEDLPEKEEIVIFTAEVALAGQPAQPISWAYPVKLFTELIQHWAALPKARPGRIQLSPFSVSLIDVPVKAELGLAILSMSDLLRMQKGDVLVLDKTINEPSLVYIGKDALFSAQTGVYNDRVSVQLLNPLHKKDGKASKKVAPAKEKEPVAVEQKKPEPAEAEEPKGDVPARPEETENEAAEHEEDILDNITDLNDDEEDEEFIWDEEDTLDEDF